MLMQMLAQLTVEPQWYSLLKDLGGWAVVVYIVHWLTRKVEMGVKELGGQMLNIVSAMREEATQHSQAHDAILRDLAEGRRISSSLLESMQRMSSRTEQWHEQRSVLEAHTGDLLEQLVQQGQKQIVQKPPKQT